MKLFLSSENVGNYPEVFKAMVSSGKLAVNHNAIDYWPDKDKKKKVNIHLKQLKGQGFKPEEIDLRDYFGKSEKLIQKISEFNGIFCFGGNTFILRRAMAASGLDKILKELVPAGKLAYGGSSAGSMVMCPDLKGPDWSDEDRADIVPKGYNPKPIFKGLNVVPFYLVPHYGNPLHGDSPNRLEDYYKEHKLKHHILADGQVYIIDGKKQELLK